MSNNDEKEFDEDLIAEYENQKHHEEKIESYIDTAKEQILEDKDFFDTLKDQIINDDDYLDAIINSKYSKIEILKNKKEYIEVRGTLELNPSEISIVEVKRKYPNAEVIATNHHGVIIKLTVVEKVRIEK